MTTAPRSRRLPAVLAGAAVAALAAAAAFPDRPAKVASIDIARAFAAMPMTAASPSCLPSGVNATSVADEWPPSSLRWISPEASTMTDAAAPRVMPCTSGAIDILFPHVQSLFLFSSQVKSSQVKLL